MDDGGHLVEGRVGVNPDPRSERDEVGPEDGFVAEFFEASTAADCCRGNGMLRAQARLERIAGRRTVGALDRQRMKSQAYRVRASDLTAVLEAGIEQRMQHDAARLWLENDVQHFPVLAKAVG